MRKVDEIKNNVEITIKWNKLEKNIEEFDIIWYNLHKYIISLL